MKNTVLIIALSTAVSLNAVNPFQKVETEAASRVARIVKMKRFSWAAADKQLNELNDKLLYTAKITIAPYEKYFPNNSDTVSVPNMTEGMARDDYSSLNSLRQTLRDQYNATATLVNTEKLDNKDFQLLGREIATGFYELEAALDKIRVQLNVKYNAGAAANTSNDATLYKQIAKSQDELLPTFNRLEYSSSTITSADLPGIWARLNDSRSKSNEFAQIISSKGVSSYPTASQILRSFNDLIDNAFAAYHRLPKNMNKL